MTFRLVRLREVADEVTVGFVGSMASEYVANGVPFLRSLNVEPYRVSLKDLKFISPEFHRRLKKSALRPGDVVIVRTGKPGTCAVVPDWLREANCSDLVVVRCGPEIDPRYLSYWVNSLASHHVDSNLVGAVQQHFNVGAAKEMPILLPPIDEQERILSAIASLDEKIELNRQINETLEAMAQAIFQDWFVDFGPVRRRLAGVTEPIEIMGGLIPDPARAAKLAGLFPEALTDEGLPSSWEAMSLGSLAEQVKGSVNPLQHSDELFEHYSLPAYDAGQAPTIELGFFIKSNKTPVHNGSILLSKLNPEIPRVWLPNDADGTAQIASTEFLVFRPRSGVGRGLLYFLFKDPSVRQVLEGMVTGTSKSHQRISPPALLATSLITGAANCFGAFEELVAPMLMRLLSLRAEERTLTETRNYLLPRLMSGEVRVRDAARGIAA